MTRRGFIPTLSILALAAGALLLPRPAARPAAAGRAACVWAPHASQDAVAAHLQSWAAANALGSVLMWNASLQGDLAVVDLHLAAGDLVVSWHLDAMCQPTSIEIRPSAAFSGAVPARAALERLAADFPAPQVHSDVPPSAAPSGVLSRSFSLLLIAAALGATLAGVILVIRDGGRRAASRVLASARAAPTRVLLMLLGLSSGFVVFEVAARWADLDARLMAPTLFYLTGGDFSEHRTASDPFLHYELTPDSHLTRQDPAGRPYTVNIDRFGARLPAHPGAKGPGIFRILCFGGSTLFGANVNDDQTIPAAMERHLNRTGRRFEVWNFGTSAYNLAQAAHLARRELTLLHPDLIVVQLLNRFPRPFYLRMSAEPAGLIRTFERDDPYFFDEQFPAPPWVTVAVHRVAIQHSATYRAAMGLYRRFNRPSPEFSDRLGAEEARALVREAAARNVTVVFAAVPAARGGLEPDAVYPGLPLRQFIDLNQAGREPEFYEAHPPARILDEYARQLAHELFARGLLPLARAE